MTLTALRDRVLAAGAELNCALKELNAALDAGGSHYPSIGVANVMEWDGDERLPQAIDKRIRRVEMMAVIRAKLSLEELQYFGLEPRDEST